MPEVTRGAAITAWIAALRSGKYSKTTGVLKDDDGYCCLGVANEFVLGCTWYKSVGGAYYDQHNNHALLDPETAEELGLFENLTVAEVGYFNGILPQKMLTEANNRQDALTCMNDMEHTTFDDIADTIEELGWDK